MTGLAFVTLDVFTDRPFSGNPLALVRDAGALTPAQMLTLAREFNLSETIFVMPPRDPAHTARVRIFFPTAEIPFAGHPTIGCAILLAEEAMGPGDWETTVTLEEEAGLVPVAVTRAGGVTRAELTAPVLPRRLPDAIDPALCAAALGLASADLGPAEPAVWSGGPAFLFVELRDRAALARARPMEPQWSALMAGRPFDSAYLHAPGHDTDREARMFSPQAGIPEDPATGSATAILAGPLLAAGALPEGETRLTLRQGADMGRPSLLGLRAVVRGGEIVSVHVAGGALRISEGRIRLP